MFLKCMSVKCMSLKCMSLKCMYIYYHIFKVYVPAREGVLNSLCSLMYLMNQILCKISLYNIRIQNKSRSIFSSEFSIQLLTWNSGDKFERTENSESSQGREIYRTSSLLVCWYNIGQEPIYINFKNRNGLKGWFAGMI